MKIKKDLLIAWTYIFITVASLTLLVWRAAVDINAKTQPTIQAAKELVAQADRTVKESQEEIGKVLERIEKLRKSLPFDAFPRDELNTPFLQDNHDDRDN
jgi:hypothetical protein